MRSMSRISRRTMFAQARAFLGVRAHGTVHLPAKKMHGKSRGLLRRAFRTSSSPSGGYRGVYIVLCICICTCTCTCTWVIGTSHGKAIGKSMATPWQTYGTPTAEPLANLWHPPWKSHWQPYGNPMAEPLANLWQPYGSANGRGK